MKTRSKILFERFLAENGLPFRPIPVGPGKTLDYGVTIGDVEIVLEVKEIVADRVWADDVVHSGTVGERIRQKINGSKRQMQAASRQGKPTVLLIFNNYDPLQLSGTENHDFEHAMYREYTLSIDVYAREIVDRFHGHGKSFQGSKKKNTSFSALGRLKQEGLEASLTVTLFENIHAAVPLDYTCLPPCFEVIRVGASTKREHRGPDVEQRELCGMSLHGPAWRPRSTQRGPSLSYHMPGLRAPAGKFGHAERRTEPRRPRGI
jgi:hypothetical protein